jgi:hypothetical protein
MLLGRLFLQAASHMNSCAGTLCYYQQHVLTAAHAEQQGAQRS